MGTFKFVLVVLMFSSIAFSQEDSSAVKEKRNLLGIGYQVGGGTLIGVDYEIRVHDFIGVHFGGGFAGYNAGINIHLSPVTKSNFVSISFEDGGFGLLNMITVEFGGLWGFGKTKNKGIYYNAGIVAILSIDSTLEDLLFKGKDAPSVTPYIGIGYGVRL